jgi:nitroreductase
MIRQDQTLSTVEAIKQRRAIKHYDSLWKMGKSEIEELVSLAALSPTAFNIQHYRFVAVTDPAEKAALGEAAFGQQQVVECSVLFVITADIMAWDKNPQRYWRNSPKEVQEGIVGAIRGFYKGRADLQRDEAELSAGMAAQTLMIAAKSLGYDSCPMRGFDFDKVAKIINLPPDHLIAMMISVGKAAEPAHPRSGPLPLSEVMINGKF